MELDEPDTAEIRSVVGNLSADIISAPSMEQTLVGPTDDVRTYRICRSNLWLGIAGTLFFGAMAVFSTLAAFWNLDGSFAHPLLEAVVFGAAFSAFTSGYSWLILSYLRERLVLDAERITHLGVISTRSLPIHNITHVRWRVGGSVVVSSPVNKLVISLRRFCTQDRNDIAAFIRKAVEQNLQEDWPGIDSLLSRRPNASPVRPSRTFLLVVALILLGFAGVFAWFWRLGIGVEHLVFAVTSGAIAVWYLWRLKRLIRRPA